MNIPEIQNSRRIFLLQSEVECTRLDLIFLDSLWVQNEYNMTHAEPRIKEAYKSFRISILSYYIIL